MPACTHEIQVRNPIATTHTGTLSSRTFVIPRRSPCQRFIVYIPLRALTRAAAAVSEVVLLFTEKCLDPPLIRSLTNTKPLLYKNRHHLITRRQLLEGRHHHYFRDFCLRSEYFVAGVLYPPPCFFRVFFLRSAASTTDTHTHSSSNQQRKRRKKPKTGRVCIDAPPQPLQCRICTALLCDGFRFLNPEYNTAERPLVPLKPSSHDQHQSNRSVCPRR